MILSYKKECLAVSDKTVTPSRFRALTVFLRDITFRVGYAPCGVPRLTVRLRATTLGRPYAFIFFAVITSAFYPLRLVRQGTVLCLLVYNNEHSLIFLPKDREPSPVLHISLPYE